MLELIVLWGYMLFVHTAIGIGNLGIIYKRIGRDPEKIGFVQGMLAGVVTITVYAQFVSIFTRVSMAAHLVLLALAAGCIVCFKNAFFRICKRFKEICFSWEGVLYLIFIVMTAYFASRGLQHTDTGIYHAQAIRWYEEYGLVTGLGNLQQHFAYNSAWLAHAAIFSMKWLTGQSLHPTTGFLQAFLCVWALYGLKNFSYHENHAADGCRIAILIYAIVNAEGTMSPATDYGTMYLVLWVVTMWAEFACERKGQERMDDYALLCVAVVCVATCKLSAGLLVFLVLYPAVWLLKNREWKRIGMYLGLGILVLVPFLIRNVILSGWLVYPYAPIDLFDVDWKIPVEYLQHDSDQIKVWGRCLYDVNLIDMPVLEWISYWWAEKDRYEMMLIYANVFAVLLLLLALADEKIRKRKIAWDQMVLYAAVLACIAGWFWTAPFIRYGLAFLLVLPLMTLGMWIKKIPMGPVRIVSGFGCAAVFFSMSMYWDYYVLTDLVWIKQHLGDQQYLVQQDYDRTEHGELQMDSLTIYYPLSSDNNSYHSFPSTAYEFMAERSEMRGKSIEDGFRAKD